MVWFVCGDDVVGIYVYQFRYGGDWVVVVIELQYCFYVVLCFGVGWNVVVVFLYCVFVCVVGGQYKFQVV